MKYLIFGSQGPGFSSPDDVIDVLDNHILPTFDILTKLESEKKILAGGLPVGDRALVFIMESSSNEDVDQFLRNLPAWGVLEWDVTPLQSFKGRAIVDANHLAVMRKNAGLD